MTKESWILQAKKLKEEARKQPEKNELGQRNAARS